MTKEDKFVNQIVADEAALRAGIKAGRKQVVDWLDEHNILIGYSCAGQNGETTTSCQSLSFDPGWKAQLARWEKDDNKKSVFIFAP